MLEQVNHPGVSSLRQPGSLTQSLDSDLSVSSPELSVVIPTRNERDNVLTLVRRLSALQLDLPMEFIFVDDSTDSTPAAIEASRTVTKSEIVLIHREPEQRIGGLGGAVIEGIRAARAPIVVVMDADLQHPPELIPEMYSEAVRSSADVVRVVRPRYRVEHHDADGIQYLGGLDDVAPHHSSLEPFISQLLRKGADGTVFLIHQESGSVVTRRRVKPFPSKAGDRFLEFGD